jgi:hypothetical protein
VREEKEADVERLRREVDTWKERGLEAERKRFFLLFSSTLFLFPFAVEITRLTVYTFNICDISVLCMYFIALFLSHIYYTLSLSHTIFITHYLYHTLSLSHTFTHF